MFTLKKSKGAKKTLKFVSEMEKRYKALRHRVVYTAASGILDLLRTKIPQAEEWNTYRDGLELAHISSKRSGLYTIHLPNNPSASGTKKIDPPRTLIYFRAHRRLSRIPPAVQVLVKYSPWTAATLPFTPSKRDAIMISRNSTKQVTSRVTSERRKDRPFWSRELQKAGRRETKKSNRPKTDTAKPMPDYAHKAIRLEFGLGIRAVPHWRPSVGFFKNAPSEILRLDPSLNDYLDPKFRGWKNRPTRIKNTISRAEAKNFIPFQRKLGL